MLTFMHLFSQRASSESSQSRQTLAKLKRTSFGKWADMVVLNRDYMTVAVDEIRDIKPIKTIIGGKIVYDSESDKP